MRFRAILFVPMTAALGGLLGLTAGCDDDDFFGETVCEANGITYVEGDTFPSPDGNGTCTCRQYGPSCNGTGGTGGTGTRCSYGGFSRAPGTNFPATDGCNTCSCQTDGSVACTERACAGTCAVDGGTVSTGFSFPSPDGCNTCTCAADGSVGCTKIACPPRDAGTADASDASPDAG